MVKCKSIGACGHIFTNSLHRRLFLCLFSVADTTVLIPSGRMQILEDGSLLIAAVRASDAGKYTCIRTNEAGSVEESAFLSVLGKILFSI